MSETNNKKILIIQGGCRVDHVKSTLEKQGYSAEIVPCTNIQELNILMQKMTEQRNDYATAVIMNVSDSLLGVEDDKQSQNCPQMSEWLRQVKGCIPNIVMTNNRTINSISQPTRIAAQQLGIQVLDEPETKVSYFRSKEQLEFIDNKQASEIAHVVTQMITENLPPRSRGG